ncbi:VMAP-C domain-containing protein [Streptomyces sp. ALB3]|uniref:VMAP-C domain-containing protein n=1 Tax=Streptomyces sp. ALB3 TaxID=3374278 RepID=UPI00378787BE
MVNGLLGPGEPDEARARLVGGLVNFLCVQDFVTDRDQCAQFIAFVAEQLGAEINYPRTNPRADMLSFARELLKYDKGLAALTFSVGIIAGPDCARQLMRIAETARTDEQVVAASSEFTDREVREAHRLLGDAWRVGEARVHAVLDHELGAGAPYGRTPAALFDHLCGVNTQADGLPPALVLVEAVASLAQPASREALRDWSDAWARGVGADVVRALEERRRTIAARPPADPQVSRCLVVMVEPADDSSADVYVRHWVNASPGYWEPVAGDIERVSMDTLAGAVERALSRGASRWADVGESENDPPIEVEFVLPFQYLNHDMARIELGTRSRVPVPIGLRYHVHLRSLERMRARDPAELGRWRARWTQFKKVGVAEAHRWHGEQGDRLERWRAGLAANPRLTAVILDVPALPGHGLDALIIAIEQGVGVAAWDRRADSPDLAGQVLTLLLAHPPSQLPSKVSQIRKEAEELGRDSLSVGKHMAFFWDDPYRLVDCEELTA